MLNCYGYEANDDESRSNESSFGELWHELRESDLDKNFDEKEWRNYYDTIDGNELEDICNDKKWPEERMMK